MNLNNQDQIYFQAIKALTRIHEVSNWESAIEIAREPKIKGCRRLVEFFKEYVKS